MGSFMSIALLLKQSRVFAVLARNRPRAAHISQIEGGRVGAAHEPHQIRCGQEYPVSLNRSHCHPLVERNLRQDLHLDRSHVQP